MALEERTLLQSTSHLTGEETGWLLWWLEAGACSKSRSVWALRGCTSHLCHRGTQASSAFLSACPDVGQKQGRERWDLKAVSRQTSKVDLDYDRRHQHYMVSKILELETASWEITEA